MGWPGVPWGFGKWSGSRGRVVRDVLRLSLVEPAASRPTHQGLLVIECNIDDAPGEFLGSDLQDDLREQGAVEVFLMSTQMKKGRPGTQLTALTPPDRLDAVTDWLLERTATIGLRWHEVERKELPRRSYRVETPYGSVAVKEVTSPSGARRIKIEYDSIRRISRQQGMNPQQAQLALLAMVSEGQEN